MPVMELASTRSHVRAGRDGLRVVIVQIEGGGHTWPGPTQARHLFGKTALDLEGQRPDLEVLPEASMRDPLSVGKKNV